MEDDFSTVWGQVLALYQADRFEDALDYVERVAPGLSEFRFDTSYWRMGLACRSGRRQLALDILSEALSDGLWYHPEALRDDPDLAALQGDPEFERLVAVCVERAATANAARKRESIILAPPGDGPFPLLIALHGNAGGLRYARWTRPWQGAVDAGWIVLLAQSTQAWGPDRYVWNDSRITAEDVLWYYEEARKGHPVNEGRIRTGRLLAGRRGCDRTCVFPVDSGSRIRRNGSLHSGEPAA